MTDLPPSRYRVVERDRRLVVIDNWDVDGRPASVTPPPPPARAEPSESNTPTTLLDRAIAGTGAGAEANSTSNFIAVRETSFDGRAELTTHPFFDAKGPRRINLAAGGADTMKLATRTAVGTAVAIGLIMYLFSPYLLLPVVALAFAVRLQIRAAITRWLDTVEREGS